MNKVVLTSNNSFVNIETKTNNSNLYRFEVKFDDDLPIKYQEVAYLASQYKGTFRSRKDDEFLLTGIKNILEGV